MKALIDSAHILSDGLQAIRDQYAVPTDFPLPVLAAAEGAARRPLTEHVDRTAQTFVTLDPATSTDLDQAFAIEASGKDLILHYAIADVAWFVRDGDLIDTEAWRRGMTQYLPDGKVSLYPPVLCENAASLLPNGPRPAVNFSVRVRPDGDVLLDGVERAIVQSRAKFAYNSAKETDLPPGFSELAKRIEDAESRRGASRVDPPEQEVSCTADGRYELLFRPPLLSEQRNAALSLATNLAVAAALQSHHTGLFRVMAEPDGAAIERLRHMALAYGLVWPRTTSLKDYTSTLDPAEPRQAALMLAIRRAGKGASYTPFSEGVKPWHSAMAATYAHATAPLRRLADRYVVQATLAVANGNSVPEMVHAAFERLPSVMAKAGMLGGQLDRAVIDLAEAVLLKGREGEQFQAVITEINERGTAISLCDLPVVTRIAGREGPPGSKIAVTLKSVDLASRKAEFT